MVTSLVNARPRVFAIVTTGTRSRRQRRLDSTKRYFQVFLPEFRRLITGVVSSGRIVHKIKIFNSADQLYKLCAVCFPSSTSAADSFCEAGLIIDWNANDVKRQEHFSYFHIFHSFSAHSVRRSICFLDKFIKLLYRCISYFLKLTIRLSYFKFVFFDNRNHLNF